MSKTKRVLDFLRDRKLDHVAILAPSYCRETGATRTTVYVLDVPADELDAVLDSLWDDDGRLDGTDVGIWPVGPEESRRIESLYSGAVRYEPEEPATVRGEVVDG